MPKETSNALGTSRGISCESPRLECFAPTQGYSPISLTGNKEDIYGFTARAKAMAITKGEFVAMLDLRQIAMCT